MVKVKAATILETVIAMVIILAVFAVAGTIFLNLSKSGLTEKRIRANESINNYYDQLIPGEIPQEDKTVINGFLINADIAPYQDKTNIVVVHCRVYDTENNTIAEQKRIVLINK